MNKQPRNIKNLLSVPKSDAKSVARGRLLFAGLLGGVGFLMIVMQVFSLSLGGALEGYLGRGSSHGKAQLASIASSPSLRGKITDSKGRLLAASVPAYEIYADPTKVMNPRDATLKLRELLPNLTEEEIYSKLIGKSRYAELSARASPATYAKVLERGIVGVYGRKRITRVYPQKNEAAHIIGAVNKDGLGIAGIEAGVNKRLAQGEDIQLSIDIAVQSILRSEIAKQIDRFEAIGGAGVILDVRSGEIIALASLPDYDANFLNKASKAARFNRATKGLYEFGSTFKIFNTAMALDSGTFNPNDKINVVKTLRVGGFTIRDYHPEKNNLNIAEVMVVSSNKGSAIIADTMGPKIQKKYLRSLGLMDRLNLKIPETATPMTPNVWRRSNVMTISYGHGISITLTHLAAAVATTVGNGERVQASLLKGGEKSDYAEEVFRPKTIAQIRGIMRRVVTHKRGTGKFADVDGYVVGGKTGTAEKNSQNGYDKSRNIASFAASFPAHDPRYVVVVMVDEPKGQKFSHNYATGGWVAAPAVGQIIRRIAPLLNVSPVNENSPQITPLLKVSLPQLDAELRHASY